jgi:hypothetical protein
VPDVRYLRLHAACCKVAHLSGAAEYMEKYYRDSEDISVPAQNASLPLWVRVAVYVMSIFLLLVGPRSVDQE